jgi:L-aminopeptidase/D-esterase-like protein
VLDQPEHCRPENGAREDLADDGGLPKAFEQAAEEARGGERCEDLQQDLFQLWLLSALLRRARGSESPEGDPTLPGKPGAMPASGAAGHSGSGGASAGVVDDDILHSVMGTPHAQRRGSLTDVPGLSVGHWTDEKAATGCTVVLCDGEGAVASADVRGAAPGTRETDLLDPVNAVQRVHAVLIGGGSAFGLDAACGVMRWLEAHGRGVEVGPLRVPVVPAAVLFDLPIGRSDVRPDAAAGEAACEAASTAAVAQGSIGAGTGATVGKLTGFERATKSGLGSASLRLAGGVTVGALVAVNAAGDVVDPVSGAVVAGPRRDGGGFVRSSAWLRKHEPRIGVGENTTLAVVATDAELTKPEVAKVAQMAHDGLARAIDPVHTMLDGDTVFALATGASGARADVTAVGAAAATALTEAVLAAVRKATSLAGVPAVRDLTRDKDATGSVGPGRNAGPGSGEVAK